MVVINQDSKDKKIEIKEKLEAIGISVNIEDGQVSYNKKEKLKIECESLYLLRHGHTKATQEHVFMSDISDNAHICEKGIQDILKLEKCNEKYKFDSVIICSDIPRVVETSNIFKSVNQNLKYFYHKNFKGINNQGWENKNVNTFNEQDLEDYKEREIKHNIFAKSVYGESWGQVLINCINLIEYLNKEHKNERVLLIGQGSIIRGIDIITGKFEEPWDNYNVKKLYNFEEKNNEDNYGTISCIIEKNERKVSE